MPASLPHVLPVVLIDSKDLRVELASQGPSLVFKATGYMNRNLDFPALGAYADSFQSLQFDLGGVVQFNSVGIREWLIFLEEAQARFSCQFLSVGEAFIEQASFVYAMLGKAGTPVLSCELPYECAGCENRNFRPTRIGEIMLQGDAFVAPPFVCPKCGRPGQFDGREEDYVSFFKKCSG